MGIRIPRKIKIDSGFSLRGILEFGTYVVKLLLLMAVYLLLNMAVLMLGWKWYVVPYTEMPLLPWWLTLAIVLVLAYSQELYISHDNDDGAEFQAEEENKVTDPGEILFFRSLLENVVRPGIIILIGLLVKEFLL